MMNLARSQNRNNTRLNKLCAAAFLFLLISFSFAQSPAQPSTDELRLAGHFKGSHYDNALLGVSYELPKGVELDPQFAEASHGPNVIFGALDRKWKQGKNQKMVVFSAVEIAEMPREWLEAKVKISSQSAGFHLIQPVQQTQFKDGSGYVVMWELNGFAGVFVTRSCGYTVVWSFMGADEAELRKVTESIQSIHVTTDIQSCKR